MLALLTKYLLRYKKVCIPNVGTFEIVMRSPQLDVADKSISPAVYVTQHSSNEQVPDHQFHFFTVDGMDMERLRRDLFSFGEGMKRQVQQSPFYWKGFGTLRYASNEMLFEADEILPAGWQTVPAEKVLRKNVQHSVLVGEKEMTAQEVTAALSKVEYKRPWFIIAGWILLVLAVAAILIYLYMKNFKTTSTGLGTW